MEKYKSKLRIIRGVLRATKFQLGLAQRKGHYLYCVWFRRAGSWPQLQTSGWEWHRRPWRSHSRGPRCLCRSLQGFLEMCPEPKIEKLIINKSKKQIRHFKAWFSGRAGEPANFFPVPAPDFFFKRLRLRLLIFFPKRLRLWLLVFFQAAPAPAPRSQKHPAPAPDYWLSLPKYSFPHKLVKVNGKKNIKQVK